MQDISLPIIEGAVQGDSEALGFILSHFRMYIRALATKTLTDEYGNQYIWVGEEIVSRLEAKLIAGIINKFDINY
ncbi:MAG: helix-turn-helix domain-containing protein [Clostridia bacterium]|nr:helix-turn-helix domain-containing protein [Clostridia bacterium]